MSAETNLWGGGEGAAPPPRPRVGLVLAGLTGGAALALTALTAPFVVPAFRKVCLPYVPASSTQVGNVLQALKGRPRAGSTLVDLGSGDGRLVIAAAQTGRFSRCVGVELNPWLVAWARAAAWRGGVRRSTRFTACDLWKTDLAEYDTVLLFGVPDMMADIERKLASELRTDACVVACRFPLPNSAPEAVVGEGVDTVWRYSVVGKEPGERSS